MPSSRSFDGFFSIIPTYSAKENSSQTTAEILKILKRTFRPTKLLILAPTMPKTPPRLIEFQMFKKPPVSKNQLSSHQSRYTTWLSTELLIRKLPFQHLAREIDQDFKTDAIIPISSNNDEVIWRVLPPASYCQPVGL